jgi:ParB family transcriptional regulator, chromosome partitioning protein
VAKPAKGLGKGLGAFFDGVEVKADDTIIDISLKELRPNPYQPRKEFDQDAIEDLKDSILQHGIIQPIIVKKSIRGYEIIAGERRFRASKEANLETIPAVVRDYNEEKMREIALVENLQRENLNAVEEAEAYHSLLDVYGLTQEELSKRVGKSRSHIANYLRLLHLPAAVRAMIANDTLTMGHGKVLSGLKKREKIILVAEKIIKEKLNVRQLEQLVQQINENVPRETKKKKPEKKDLFLKEKENVLSEHFGTMVNITKKKKKGKVEIEFYSEEDLQRIIDILEGR